jgi:hypothetical protein
VCRPAGNGSSCDDGGVCCNATCIHPECDLDRYNPLTCECGCQPGQHLCADGRCIPENTCCDPCGPAEKCCQGHCRPCPEGGVCDSNGDCTCSGVYTIYCPPSPTFPLYGHCCRAGEFGSTFDSCRFKDITGERMVDGCSYRQAGAT